MVVDSGPLPLWSHDKPTRTPPETFDDKAMQKSAEEAIDFRIEGKDAEEAGRKFDRRWNPFYLYDIPEHGVVINRSRPSFSRDRPCRRVE